MEKRPGPGKGGRPARASRRGRRRAATGTAEPGGADALVRGVLDSAPDALVVIDREGRIVLANAQVERLFGYTRRELLDSPMERLLPQGLGAVRAAHRASRRTRPMGAGLDPVGRRKDGAEFPVEISLGPLRIGRRLLVTAIVRDVTERRGALAAERRARREAEGPLALLEKILNAAPVGLAFVDADLRYLRVNDALAAMNGLPVSAHLGRSPSEVRSDLGTAIESLQRRALETNQPVLGAEVEGETSPAPGHRRGWLASCYPVRTHDGRVLGIGCVVEDVTERRNAEAEREELLTMAERARADAERAAWTVERVQAVTDAALARLSLEDALPELLARIHRMLAVDTSTILLLDETAARLRVQAAFGLDEARAREVVIPVGHGFAGRVAELQGPIAIEAVDPDHVLNPLLIERGLRSLLGVPLLADGRVFGVLHVGSCTPRCFSDDDVRLLQLVADRVALVVVRGRLYDAERDARAAAEASLRTRAELELLKDDLTNMVVHDLKNPVNGIAMLAQLALRKGRDLPTTARNSLLQIERSCHEMIRLIQNVLEISKLETGKMPVSLERIVLAEVVDEVAADYGPVAEQTGRRLSAAVGADLPYVVADRALLKRILVNLVVNALRHSGSEHVKVEATPDPTTARLRLEVTDYGCGIAEEDQARVFEKFAASRRTGNGEPSSDSGLGLPFCKLATECMGGEIFLRSHPETGTVFTVVLPTQPAEERATTRRPTAPGSATAAVGRAPRAGARSPAACPSPR
jgi:PAS domain S-box-containing protein